MYESPSIKKVGTLPELTLAQGSGLLMDNIFNWGDHRPDDPPVGS